MSQFDCDKLMSSLQSEVDYSNFKDVDIVIEAVFEDINLKHRIIKEVRDLQLVSRFWSSVFKLSGLALEHCFLCQITFKVFYNFLSYIVSRLKLQLLITVYSPVTHLLYLLVI